MGPDPTHWHDDHIQKIGSLFEEAAEAEFVFPAAMLKAEFINFAATFAGGKIRRFGSGVEEFGRVITIAGARRKPHSKHPLRGASNETVQYRQNSGALAHGQPVTLETLSPSHFDVQAFMATSAGEKAIPGGLLMQAPKYGANDVSSAFWLQIGSDGVLLGADVENIPHADSGWNGILSSSVQPATQAGLVKIPHHGGVSGHHSDMWNNLLRQKPIASLTPWSIGRNSLPTPSDVDRIKTLSGESYSTNRAKYDKSPALKPMVSKLFKKDGLIPKRISDTIGHIRHRAKVGSGPFHWHTDLLGHACMLKDMIA